MYIVKRRSAYFFSIPLNDDEDSTGFTKDLNKAYRFTSLSYAIQTAKLFNATVIDTTTNEEIDLK